MDQDELRSTLYKKVKTTKELSLEIGIKDHRAFSNWLYRGGELKEPSLNKIKLYIINNNQ